MTGTWAGGERRPIVETIEILMRKKSSKKTQGGERGQNPTAYFDRVLIDSGQLHFWADHHTSTRSTTLSISFVDLVLLTIYGAKMDSIQQAVVQPLQPILRPIASALPKPVHDAVVSLVGAPCYSTLLVDLDVAKDPECTSLAISKALGIAIVGASAIVKVPQILKLIKSQSSAGVSFVSYALETASLLITLSYSVRNQFPFSTYGETALIAVQDIVVGVLVLTFAGKGTAAAAFVAVVAASVYALLFDQTLIDAQTMAYLQAGAGALGVASKAPQILTIWREGSTGQLSAFAVRLTTVIFSNVTTLIANDE